MNSAFIYNQLSKWENQGLLPPGRKDKTGWNAFTPKELFILLVSKEIRNKFQVNDNSVKFLQAYMLQEDANHFLAAVDLIKKFGLPVFLLTDFKKTFVMDSVLELSDMFSGGFGSGEGEHSYALVKVNQLVNRILKSINPSSMLEEHEVGSFFPFDYL